MKEITIRKQTLENGDDVYIIDRENFRDFFRMLVSDSPPLKAICSLAYFCNEKANRDPKIIDDCDRFIDEIVNSMHTRTIPFPFDKEKLAKCLCNNLPQLFNQKS